MITDIANRLYASQPSEPLYHYTTFSGLMGIVDCGALWASDIRYMNDAAELIHTANLIKVEVQRRLSAGSCHAQLLAEFQDWVKNRITNGHMLFATSFRSNGNLLSQWRGYSSVGKGVSLGFTPENIVRSAQAHKFKVGRCIYELGEQKNLIASVVNTVEKMACATHAQDYESVFVKIEKDLLRIAAVLKHPSFQEEDEWRVVSPTYTDYVDSPVAFREGTSMIVPYVEFPLFYGAEQSLQMYHLYVGPTPNIDISMNSVTMFLRKKGIRLARPASYCEIPYRQR